MGWHQREWTHQNKPARMEAEMEWLKDLGIGLSRALRYMYPAVLTLCLIVLINPAYSDLKILESSWSLILLSVVIGAGLYAFHRALVIPLHWLGLILLLWLWDMLCSVKRPDSSSPTRWLGSKAFGVPKCRRMLAYSALRHSERLLSKLEQDELNIAHAENGLIAITATGLFASAAYVHFSLHCLSKIGAWPLLLTGILFLVASYVMAVEQHKRECLSWREKEARLGAVTNALIDAGMIPNPKLRGNANP